MSTLAPEQPPTAAPPQPAPAPTPAPVPHVTPAPAPAPVVGMPPRIAANRRILVRRFPSLGFTISSGGLPYWEVFLFTDRSLIDPANASRRTPSNFYSSRQDGGLRRATSGDDLFLVPSAVLRGFAAAVPKPTAIYYTVAAYTTADGASPVLPASPAQLALAAPFVTVAADFTPDTVDRAMGVRSARLQVVAQSLDVAAAPAPPAAAPAPALAPAAVPGTGTGPGAPDATAKPIDPVEDAAAGEDGASYLVQHPTSVAAAPQQPPAQTAPPVPPTPTAAPVTAAPAPPPSPAVRRDDIAYDDGYGAYDDDWTANAESWTEAQEAAFPARFPHPTQLLDEDDGSGWSDASELHGVAAAFPYRALDDGTPPPALAPRPLKLTIDDKRALVESVAGAESGSDRYSAINADGEFNGRFGESHPAYQKWHVGLSYGLIQFTQDSGSLGRLLTMMRDRDAQTFTQIFGDHADELVAVTNAAGPSAASSPGGRSPRTQPVDGADLWEEPWLTRFRRAGQVTAFQAAQNELAATDYLDPMLGFAGDMGLDTDRALAMALDRSVQMGPTGARQWITAAVGPITTDALRQQALAALGFDDLGAFQKAWQLPTDNLWGPLTHAGLVGALRELGASSPISLPTTDQMLDAMVRRADADGAFWAPRVHRLRNAAGFTDHPYAR